MFKLFQPYLITIFCLFSPFYPSLVQGQLTPDHSLGPESSIVENNQGSPRDIIKGGATRGINLFHSFQDFNVGRDREVYFNNPIGIQNILTRVTGENVSHIFGKLGVLHPANLYFINPNGIILGPHASLDIKGSFLVSTADGIKLGNNGLFSATNPQDSQLLSIKPGALFTNALRNDIAKIQVNQSKLNIEHGKNFTLNSDEITINGGKITALRGNINITGKNLTITNGGILDTRTNTSGNAGNINIHVTDTVSFKNQSFANTTVDALGIGNAGNINIHAKSLFVSNGSQLDASTKGQENAGNHAGNITLKVTDRIVFKGDKSDDLLSGAFTTVGGRDYSNNGQVRGNGGDINIHTGSLSLINYSILNASTFGQGNSGHININATDKVSFNSSFAVTSVNDDAVGNGGDININAHAVSFTNDFQNQAQLYLNVVGRGNAGNVNITATDLVSFNNSDINNFVSSHGIGNAGNVNITTGSLLLANKSQFISSTKGKGNAGKINITANDRVSLKDESLMNSIVDRSAVGNAGDIHINTGSLHLSNQSQLNSSTKGKGNAGKINITANDRVSLKYGSFINSIVDTDVVGNAGDIHINTGSLFLSSGTQLNSSNKGIGTGGDINITARDQVTFDQSYINNLIGLSSIGDGGEININTDSLLMTNNSQFISSTQGNGNGGKINITANNIDLQDQSFINSIVDANAVGNAGDIEITTNSLFLRNGSQINSSTQGTGNAATVNINAADTISFDGVHISETGKVTGSGVFSAVGTSAIGKGGEINISAKSLTITNGAELISSTTGRGDGGKINIIAQDRISLDGGSSPENPSKISTGVDSSAIGNAGEINISSNSFYLTNGAELISSTTGRGDGGKINIIAQDRISLDGGSSPENPSKIATGVDSSAIGNAGEINISSNSFYLTNGAELISSTSGQGNAGNLNITTTDIVYIDNSFARTTVGSDAVGSGGQIKIFADTLSLMNDAELSAITLGQGEAGSIIVEANTLEVKSGSQLLTNTVSSFNAGDINILSPKSIILSGQGSGLFANTESSGTAGNISINTPTLNVTDGATVSASTNKDGRGGNINVLANTLTATNGAQFLTTTSGSAQAGNINLNIKDNITLDGTNTGLFANTEPGSTGKSGSITIDPQTFIISNAAGIGVNSQGSGEGGDIYLQAGLLSLNNQAFISAETASNQGGNINLAINDLLLFRNNSNISASAGTAQAGGNGGNITINAPFIVSFPNENSDITANAFEGNGGNINITTNALFGIEFQTQQTPRSDITASSQFGVDGNVQINRPDVDPTKGLVDLPTNLVDPSDQIDNSCKPGSAASQSYFVATGRGGLPLSPTQPLQDTSTLAQWVKPRTSSQHLAPVENQPQASAVTTTSPVSPPAIVEASSWVVDANGKIYLVAQAPQVTPSSPGQTSASCAIKN